MAYTVGIKDPAASSCTRGLVSPGYFVGTLLVANHLAEEEVEALCRRKTQPRKCASGVASGQAPLPNPERSRFAPTVWLNSLQRKTSLPSNRSPLRFIPKNADKFDPSFSSLLLDPALLRRVFASCRFVPLCAVLPCRIGLRPDPGRGRTTPVSWQNSEEQPSRW